MPKRIVPGFAAFFLLALSAFAAPRVAVLAPENKTGDPRLDYVGGIVQGLLQFDLATDGAVDLVDRSTLDAALKERELSLSAVAAEPSKASGGVLPADYLVSTEYAILATNLMFTVKLVDVQSTRTQTFSEGGSTENAVHSLAERVSEKLTGKRPSFKGEGKGRSLLSLRDETPGSIALHSHLIDARIILDGEFVGYTTGDRRKPFVVEGVSPGDHSISTDLGADFGTVALPAVTFDVWKATVRVQSAKRSVVEDGSTHFNDVIYRLMELANLSKTVAFGPDGTYSLGKSFSFQDRQGKNHTGRIAGTVTKGKADGTGTCAAVFVLDGKEKAGSFEYGENKEGSFSWTEGVVAFNAKISLWGSSPDLQLNAARTDLHQGMHRDER